MEKTQQAPQEVPVDMAGQIEAWLHSFVIFIKSLMTTWSLIQFCLIAAALGLAFFLARYLNSPIEENLRKISGKPRLLRFLAITFRKLNWIIFVILLWPIAAILQETTWLSRSYFVILAVKLATAWVVISIASRTIRNRTMAKAVASGAWIVAALEILGLREAVSNVLDALAIRVGNINISILLILKGLLLFGILLWAVKVLSGLLEQQLRSNKDLTPSVRVLLEKVSNIILIAMAVMITLSSLGVDLTALTVFSGAVGLGIGFGLQKVVSNLISGMIILMDKSIKPGDVISLGETFGWISSLKARYVSVVTRDGREYLVPNEEFITQKVVNWSYTNRLVRLDIHFGVSYDSNPHEVRRIACASLMTTDRVAHQPGPVCHITGFGDSSIDFVLRFWIKDPESGLTNIRGAAFLALWDAFEENCIKIPYPHHEVILKTPIKIEPGAS